MKIHYLSFILIFLANCHSMDQSSEVEIEAAVQKEMDALWDTYRKYDPAWTDHYQDKYTTVSSSGEVKETTRQALRKEWENLFSVYEIDLQELSEPTFVTSQDQVVSILTFDTVHDKTLSADLGQFEKGY